MVRLGKRKGRETDSPRPMLIKLKNEEEKWKILRNAKNLKNENNPHKRRVGITKDLTREEREQNRKLREMIKEKKAEGQEGWFIKNGELRREQGWKKRY